MIWPIEHFHYIPAPSSFIEMMPGTPTIVAFPPTGAHGAQVPEPVVGACARWSRDIGQGPRIGVAI